MPILVVRGVAVEHVADTLFPAMTDLSARLPSLVVGEGGQIPDPRAVEDTELRDPAPGPVRLAHGAVLHGGHHPVHEDERGELVVRVGDGNVGPCPSPEVAQ